MKVIPAVRGRTVNANATAGGGIRGIRAMLEQAGGDDRLMAAGLQTVGAKGWDGVLVGVVR